MKKIAFIGAGGIMSNFTKYFIEMMDNFDKRELCYIKIFDYDIVEEKNLIRSNQNFKPEELMMNKAEALSVRYKDWGIDFENIKIDETTINKLDVFDDIIVGVDNHKVRKLLYEYALKNSKWLIDMRSHGTLWAFTIVDGTYTMEHYNTTMFKNEEVMEKKGSCQRDEDIVNDTIQNANKTVAFYVANCIYLQHLRNTPIAITEFKTAY